MNSQKQYRYELVDEIRDNMVTKEDGTSENPGTVFYIKKDSFSVDSNNGECSSNDEKNNLNAFFSIVKNNFHWSYKPPMYLIKKATKLRNL